jgi:hypothetical protein
MIDKTFVRKMLVYGGVDNPTESQADELIQRAGLGEYI